MSTGTMNKVTTIGWSNMSWNPISGCRHACRSTYCYNTMKSTAWLNRFGARYWNDRQGKFVKVKQWRRRETKNHNLYIARPGEVYPRGYDPTFYEHRLDQPGTATDPARVFVVDVGDMLGQWVPAKWIKSIIESMEKYSWHKYFILTKNPSRYAAFQWPKNAWLGATITSDTDVATLRIMQAVKHPHKFLSIEPLFGPVTSSLQGIQWVVIGAMTGRNPPIPNPAWVDVIVKEARRVRAQIYMKDNLLKHYHPATVYQQKP
ncbi:MAG: DUF5131 family protein [Syntrophorhabdales bacterium]